MKTLGEATNSELQQELLLRAIERGARAILLLEKSLADLQAKQDRRARELLRMP